MQIKDIMVREVVSVPLDMPILAVADLMIRHSFHAVPVVDEEYHVKGLISETDFFLKDSMALHLPTYVDMVTREMKGKESDWNDSEAFKTLMKATAKDIMTEGCVTLPEVADVEDLLTLVQLHHYKTFPITDAHGVLVGIITLIDVIAAVSEQYAVVHNTK